MAEKRIRVGSLNTNKIDAVREVFTGYEVTGVACGSGVREQPIDLGEIIDVAIIRSRSVFVDCEYSVGIEDGISQVPSTKSGSSDG